MRRVARFVSALLIFCIAWTPFALQAGMIGTDQVLPGAPQLESRQQLLGFVQRADVAEKLEAYGVSSALAQERVAALTSEELAELAGNIDTLPAGAATDLALSGSTWLIAAIIALVVFIIWYRPRT